MEIDAADIQDLKHQLEAAELDARALVAGLDEERGGWRAEAGSWSVAECLDHLATTNRVYLQAMNEPARRARKRGRLRRGPAVAGRFGGWFARRMEPPVKVSSKMKSPKSIRPRPAPSLADAFASFLASQNDVRSFLLDNAELDLASIGFPNPFVPGIRFSLAGGLHIITAHVRRHLWQAWRVRRDQGLGD